MARTLACNSPDLSIHLDLAESFRPGQRIAGYVSRISPWVDTETSICIILHGRCSTKFFCSDYASCFSRLDLFCQDENQIFNGALHIQRSYPDERKWRFEIDIPRHFDPTFLRSHPFGKASYIPLSYAQFHMLPPSFDLDNATTGLCPTFALVEYYLEATMTNSDASKLVVARFPVHIRCESSPFPITDFDVKLISRHSYTVTSPRLTPGMENAKVSTKQQIAKILGVSGAPRLTFCLETSIASVLQNGSPYSIPLEIRAIPQWPDTSKAIVNFPQAISIKSFVLAIRSITSTIAFTTGAIGAAEVVREDHFKRSTILAEYPMPENKRQMVDDRFQSELRSESTPLNKYLSNDGIPLGLTIDDNSSTLNLGDLLGLKLEYDQYRISEVPTFITPNIKREYQLEWKIGLEVGGEMLRVEGKHPVLIMEEADQE